MQHINFLYRLIINDVTDGTNHAYKRGKAYRSLKMLCLFLIISSVETLCKGDILLKSIENT